MDDYVIGESPRELYAKIVQLETALGAHAACLGAAGEVMLSYYGEVGEISPSGIIRRLHEKLARVEAAYVDNQKVFTANAKTAIYAEIVSERARQDGQWGGGWAGHEPMEWIGYIQYEASLDDAERDDPIRERFVRIAALAVAAIESLDRKAK